MANELITPGFASQCKEFPETVDTKLAVIDTLDDGLETLAQGVTFQRYLEQVKASVELARPVALGVLKIKAKVGELMPAKSPGDRGQGRNGKSSSPAEPDLFAKEAKAAYRKIAASKDRLVDYYDAEADVPTQGGFLKFVANGSVLVNKMTGNNERYTPAQYIESARTVMGSIDVDAASNPHAQETIKAGTFYTEDNSGLTHDWVGNVWLNPPYEKGLVDQFVDKLLAELEADRAVQAVVLTNNSTDSGWFQKLFMAASAVALPKQRIQFYDQDNETTSPTNGQTFFYFGKQPDSFRDEFTKYGPGCMGQW